VTHRAILDGLRNADPARRRAAAIAMLDVPRLRLDAVKRALRDTDRIVRICAAATLLVKKGYPAYARLVRKSAESLRLHDLAAAEDELVDVVERIDDVAAVKNALVSLFVQHLWDHDPAILNKALAGLAWAVDDVEPSARTMHRLDDLLGHPEAAAAAAEVLTNVALLKGDYSAVATRLTDLLRLVYSYRRPALAKVAEGKLLADADRKLDISPAVPYLEAAYATGCSGDSAAWALIRHYWNQRQIDDLRRLVPVKLHDPDAYFEITTVTVSDQPMHGSQGRPPSHPAAKSARCGYCANPRTSCIYYKCQGDLTGRTDCSEYECSECGKFTYYVEER